MLYLFAFWLAQSDWQVWVAGGGGLQKIDPQGQVLATAPLRDVGAVTAVAVDRVSGKVVATTTDFVSKSFVTIADDAGKVLVSQELAGVASAVAVDGDIVVAGKRQLAEGERLYDAFVTRLRMDGSVVWSIRFGGSMNDSAQAVAWDRTGSIWFAGETRSEDLPVTADAFQRSYGGGETLGPLEYGDGFVGRLNGASGRVEFASYLGGKRYDAVTAIVATRDGVVVGGTTDSPDFPIRGGAFQTSLINPTVYMPGVHADGFVSVVSRTGGLTYSTYYGEEGRQTANAGVLGADGRVGMAMQGFSRRCVAWVALDLKFTSECHAMELQEPFALYAYGEQWIAVGRTKPGLLDRASRLRVDPFDGDRVGPGVNGVWNDSYPGYRPVIGRDSYVSVFTSPQVDLRSAGVFINGRPLKIVYAGGGQINALVPGDLPLGTQSLVIGLAFFQSIAVDVDVVERWPGLASAALNQDGTVNSASNPAERGTIVSLFGSGFGGLPLPVLEPYVQSTGATTAQGMELLFAGRVGEGLFQFNTRIPANALPGHTPVKIVIRDGNGFLSSNLAKIHIR